MGSGARLMTLGGDWSGRGCISDKGVGMSSIGDVHAFREAVLLYMLGLRRRTLLSGGADCFIQTLWALDRYDRASPFTLVVQTVSPSQRSIKQ
jgi:hypothetical protein